VGPAGRRFHVVGTSGSGKSTVAARLAATLGVPHVELDALYWEPGWTEAADDLFLARLGEALSGDGWVVCGNYGRLARAVVWARVDTVVWLDLPRSTVMRQVVTRTLRRRWRRELLWGTNRESLRKALLSRDSILWWAWSTHARNRAEYEALLLGAPSSVVRLRSRSEVDRWILSVAAAG
jgi:adenylate kinase family enzyme